MRQHRRYKNFRGLGVPVLFMLFGCGGYGSGSSSTTPTTPTGGTDALEAKFSSIQSKIFTPTCAVSGCHVMGAQAPSLEKDLAFGDLVNVPSQQAKGQTLVVRSDATASYLIRKLLGTHTEVGGSGSRMPKVGDQLSQSNIDVIKKWIDDGAKND